MGNEYLSAFINAFWHTLTNVKEMLLPIATFIVAASISFILLQRKNGSLSLAAVYRHVFPPQLFRNPSSRVDRWLFLHYLLIWGPLVAGITAVCMAYIGNGVCDSLNHHFGVREPLLTSQWAIAAMQMIVGIFFRELMDYGIHVAAHKVPFIWAIHKAHHSTEALTFFASSRAHPIDFIWVIPETMFATGLMGGIAAFLTGTTLGTGTVTAVIVLQFVLTGINGGLAHTHVRLNFGPFNRIVMSPVMHQIHHSAEAKHRDKNFCTHLGIFDWIFGTLYIPRKDEVNYRWGLNETEIGDRNPHLTVKQVYLCPLVEWRRLRSESKGRR